MKRFSQRHQLSTLSELNVTPLLDLAFVLLIIFMITTPLMENSSELIVPTSKASENATGPEETETIEINRDNVVSLGDQELTAEALRQKIEQLKAERPNLAIVVRAHKELSVQTLVDTMDIVKKAGITKIGLQSATAEGAAP